MNCIPNREVQLHVCVGCICRYNVRQSTLRQSPSSPPKNPRPIRKRRNNKTQEQPSTQENPLLKEPHSMTQRLTSLRQRLHSILPELSGQHLFTSQNAFESKQLLRWRRDERCQVVQPWRGLCGIKGGERRPERPPANRHRPSSDYGVGQRRLRPWPDSIASRPNGENLVTPPLCR